MLVSLGAKKPSDDVAGALADCHDRIRRFTALAAKLAVPGAAPPAELAEAAGRVLRYFEEALPLHAADEDRAIHPRLLAARPDLAGVLATMTAEHGPIDEAIALGLPAWRAVASDPSLVAEHREVLAEAAARLDALFATHLAVEERTVFPAVAALPAEVQAEIRAEMRARRGGR
jgi:hemerythrin-like domain-containing protein